MPAAAADPPGTRFSHVAPMRIGPQPCGYLALSSGIPQWYMATDISQIALGRGPSPAQRPHCSRRVPLRKSNLALLRASDGPLADGNNRGIAQVDTRSAISGRCEQTGHVSFPSGIRQMGTKRGLRGHKANTLRVLCSYLEKNRDRMRYDEYHASGYPIASGIIEGACRHVVRDWMERAGMRWCVAGAQAMPDLRTTYVNGQWDKFQDDRIDQARRRQYPCPDVLQVVDWPLAAGGVAEDRLRPNRNSPSGDPTKRQTSGVRGQSPRRGS